MRKAVTVLALLLALCGPAFAGDISCPPVVTPPTSAAEEAEAEGDVQCPLAVLVFTLLSLF